MDDVKIASDADRALKQKHRAMWAQGDYPTLASDLISELGAVLVEACGIRPGQRVLDVAAGAGNAAIPAAMMGADVIASDLTPELFNAGRDHAAARGASLEWQEADAEALPFPENGFDVVMSCVGVMFAPHHQAAANELVRVCRPGGTIGLLSWTPGGFIGKMFATMKPFAPPPPPGAQPPPLWGSEDHVQELLGAQVTDLRALTQTVVIDKFAGPEEFLHYFKDFYGPTISVYKFIADDQEKVDALDKALIELAGSSGQGAPLRMEWEYLLLTARKIDTGG
ncbi:class I SAM-dependent methyltransferase [Arthrobacter zhaoguopingii]|uniref:class I SAM-dependent methyltransferase n=1 Tax=Arthrobacter zhaoguopingii TaxID=2681491 RepID=UPI00135B1351|nr:methyltransferase domain-containing protein [Arthrobacter zhaoguopingii]